MSNAKRVRWTKFGAHFANNLRRLNEELTDVDVIIVAEKKEIYSHKVILSAASEFLKEILIDVAAYNTVPTIYFPEFSYDVVQAVILYIYHGEITLNEEQLPDFYKLCEELDMKRYIPDIEEINMPQDANYPSKIVELISFEKVDENNQKTIVHVEKEDIIEMESEPIIVPEQTAISPSKRISLTKKRKVEKIEHEKESKNVYKYAKLHNLNKALLYKKYAEVVHSMKEYKCKNEKLDSSVRACLLEGMPYRKSGEKYNVSKSVIYSRAKDIEGVLYDKLQEEVQKINSNKKAEIVLQLREKANDFKNRLQEALNLCRNGETPENASQKFNIPISSITRNLSKAIAENTT